MRESAAWYENCDENESCFDNVPRNTLEELSMQEPRFVRELTACEQPCFQSAKTGDTLPDGTVLLWRSDMDRMGLNALREWLRQNAVESNSVIAFGDVPARLGTLLEEEYNL